MGGVGQCGGWAWRVGLDGAVWGQVCEVCGAGRSEKRGGRAGQIAGGRAGQSCVEKAGVRREERRVGMVAEKSRTPTALWNTAAFDADLLQRA